MPYAAPAVWLCLCIASVDNSCLVHRLQLRVAAIRAALSLLRFLPLPFLQHFAVRSPRALPLRGEQAAGDLTQNADVAPVLGSVRATTVSVSWQHLSTGSAHNLSTTPEGCVLPVAVHGVGAAACRAAYLEKRPVDRLGCVPRPRRRCPAHRHLCQLPVFFCLRRLRLLVSSYRRDELLVVIQAHPSAIPTWNFGASFVRARFLNCRHFFARLDSLTWLTSQRDFLALDYQEAVFGVFSS